MLRVAGKPAGTTRTLSARTVPEAVIRLPFEAMRAWRSSDPARPIEGSTNPLRATSTRPASIVASIGVDPTPSADSGPAVPVIFTVPRPGVDRVTRNGNGVVDE